MKNAFIITWLLVLLLGSAAGATPCREVVGYYAGWKWYKRNKLVNPQTIDYTRYTIINYAFFKPLVNGRITEGDPWADKNILLGKTTSQNGVEAHDSTSSLVYNAHLNHVKVIGSVGGWTWSSVFPEIAANPLKRIVFAESCVAFIKKYNLDGIDIDWEYPGFKAHNGTPSDKFNFTLLLEEVRKALNEYETFTGKQLLLTAAVGPSNEHMSNIEWDKVTELLDIIHLMTYNYYGAWDKITNHNAPLFAAKAGSAQFAVSYSVNRLTEYYKVPTSKITLGLAFYGRSVCVNGAAELHGISKGIADTLIFREERGTPSYYSIVAKSRFYDQHLDQVAEVPYLTGKDGLGSFVSFDDPGSISKKAEFAVNMDLKGVVIWDISGDYLETAPGTGKIAGTPLCDAIHDAFCSTRITAGLLPGECEIDLRAYPNPFRDEIDIAWNSDCRVNEVRIINSSGYRVLLIDKPVQSQLKLNTTGWKNGVYFIQLLTEKGKAGEKIIKI